MEIRVYVDVLLLINMVFDYLFLWMTGFLLHRSVPTLRLLAVSFFGALYAVCVFFLPTFMYNVPCKFLVGAVMVVVAFRPRSFKQCVQYISVFLTGVFLLGGSAFCLFFNTRLGAGFGVVWHNGVFYVNLPVYLLLLLTCGCCLLLKIAFSVGSKFSLIGKRIVTLRIGFRDGSVSLKGFYDSGNMMRDRFERGVIVAEWQSLKPLFCHAESPEKTDVSWEVIHFSSLHGKGKLLAFMPESIHIERGRRLIEADRRYIGVTTEVLDFYHNWDAILPHDFEGVDDNNAVYAIQKDSECY